MSYTKEELAHFGIKGMRWGVRRSSKPRSAASQNRRKNFAKVAAIVGGALAITAGSAYAEKKMRAVGSRPYQSIKPPRPETKQISPTPRARPTPTKPMSRAEMDKRLQTAEKKNEYYKLQRDIRSVSALQDPGRYAKIKNRMDDLGDDLDVMAALKRG